MAAVTVCSDFGAQENKVCLTVSIVFPSICHEVTRPDTMIFVFWMLSFKPAFSLSSSLSPRGSLVPFHFLLVTTSHGLNDLKNRHLSLTVLEVAESRIKVLVDSVPGEVPLPTCRCHLLTMFLHSKERKQAMVSLLFLIRTLMPSWGSPRSRFHLNLITSQSLHFQRPSHWWLELQHRYTGEHIQFITYAEHPESWYNLPEMSHTL